MLVAALSILCLLALNGCISRQEVLAEVWLESGIPASACNADVAKSGVYRRLNDDICTEKHLKIPCYEFLSYCNPAIKNSVRFNGTKFNAILDAELPKAGN